MSPESIRQEKLRWSSLLGYDAIAEELALKTRVLEYIAQNAKTSNVSYMAELAAAAAEEATP